MRQFPLYYGHFLCHVFHHDDIMKEGNDFLELDHKMWKLADRRGADYPVDHNVGHMYRVKPALADFYQQIDRCNCFKPRMWQTLKFAKYPEAAA